MNLGVGKYKEVEIVKVAGYDNVENVREYLTGPIGKKGKRLREWLLPKRDGVYVIAYTLNKNGSVVRIFGNKYPEWTKGDTVTESVYLDSITLNTPSKKIFGGFGK